MATLPFDRVFIEKNGVESEVSLETFLALPLSERIRLILERRLRFRDGAMEIDRSAALKSLMAGVTQR